MSPKKGAMSPKPPKSHDDRKSSHANEKTHMCKIPVHMLFGRPCRWLQYFGTKTASLRNAVWQPLFNWESPDPANANEMLHPFKLGGKSTNRFKEVHDTIALSDPTHDFSRVVHCDLQLLPSGKLAKVSRIQLQEMGLTHHQLGRTFD